MTRVSGLLAEQVARLAMARRRRLVTARGRKLALLGAGSFLPYEPEWRAAETRRCVEEGVPFFLGRGKPSVLNRKEAARYACTAHVAYLALYASSCFRSCLADLDGIDLPPFSERHVAHAFGLLASSETKVMDWGLVSEQLERSDRRVRAKARLDAFVARRAARSSGGVEEDEDALVAA